MTATAQEERERRARHSAGGAEQAPADPPPPPPVNDSQHLEGQSVADLMSRLQVATPGSGKRRRRED
ncbi:MAG: hypothetical protein ACSLE6_10365 [Mycobacterium sp.]